MTQNLDLAQLRTKIQTAQSAPSAGLVMKLIQELEEARARHRKAWGRAEAAEQALDFHTQRDRELKKLLSMIADRLDEFCYDELSSLIEDGPLDQWAETYKSKLQAAERERDEWRGKYDESESARAVTDAAVARVREVAHYSNKAHREAILEALDGSEPNE